MKKILLTKSLVLLLAVSFLAALAFAGCASDDGGGKKSEHPAGAEHPKK